MEATWTSRCPTHQSLSLCYSAEVNSGHFFTSCSLLLWKLFELLISLSLPLFLPQPPTFSLESSLLSQLKQDTLSSLTSGLADLALGGRLWEEAWLAKGPWEGGMAWTPGLHGPSTSLRFLLLEKCLKEQALAS